MLQKNLESWHKYSKNTYITVKKKQKNVILNLWGILHHLQPF